MVSKKMNSKKFKISIVTEGQMEEIFFSWLKDSSIFKNKTLSKCKIHTHCIKGTPSERNICNKHKNCCDKYLIFDVDSIDRETIAKYKKIAKEKNVTLIINDPCLELILLSFFIYVQVEKIDKKWIEEKLNNELKKINLENYNHNPKSLGKILDFLVTSQNHQEQFKNNLIEYNNRTNNPKSNFIDLITILEGNNKNG